MHFQQTNSVTIISFLFIFVLAGLRHDVIFLSLHWCFCDMTWFLSLNWCFCDMTWFLSLNWCFCDMTWYFLSQKLMFLRYDVIFRPKYRLHLDPGLHPCRTTVSCSWSCTSSYILGRRRALPGPSTFHNGLRMRGTPCHSPRRILLSQHLCKGQQLRVWRPTSGI